MYVYIYVYICIYIHTHTHTHTHTLCVIYTYIYVCVYIYIYCVCLWMHIYLLVSLLHTRRRTHLLVYDKYAYVQAHTAHTRTCVRVQALGQDQQLKDTHTHTHTHTHTQTRTGAWQGQGAQGPSGTDAESRAASGVACGRARPCSGRGASVCVYVSMCLSSALALGLYRRSPIFPLEAPL